MLYCKLSSVLYLSSERGGDYTPQVPSTEQRGAQRSFTTAPPRPALSPGRSAYAALRSVSSDLRLMLRLQAFALARHTPDPQLTAHSSHANSADRGQKGRKGTPADLHTTRSWTWQCAPHHRHAPRVAKAASILPTPAPGHISWIRRAGTRRASSSHGCRAQSNDLSLIDAAMARSSRTDLCAIVHVVREYDGVGA